MRTLHVVEPWSPPGPLSGSSDRARHGDMAILACRGVVDSGDPDEQTILVLGGSKAGRRAAALGLVGFERIAPPLGRVELAHRSIARWLETRAPFQRAILWNGPNAGPWRHVAQDIVAFDPVTGGAGENAASLPADVATPDGVSRLRALRRDARTALGLADTDECVCLLGDPPDSANAANFAFLTALLRATGRSVAGLLGSGSFHARRALNPSRLEPLHVRLIGTDRPLPLVLPACDLAVHAPGSRLDPKPAVATWCDAALARLAWSLGVPVLSATPEVVAPRGRAACLTPTAHPSAIAHAITELSRDRIARLGRDLLDAHGGDERSPFAQAFARALEQPASLGGAR